MKIKPMKRARLFLRLTRPSPLAISIAAGLASLSLSSGAQAATFTWDGGAGNDNWGTAGNWTVAGVPTQPGTGLDDIQFGGATRLTPIMQASYNINSLTFNSGAGLFVLSNSGGTTLTIQGGGIVNNDGSLQTINISSIMLGAAQTWNAASGALTVSGAVNNNGNLLTVNAANAVTLGGAMSGSGGLTKNGASTLTLSGASANTYSGLTTVNAGTLTLSKTAGITAIAGDLTIGDGSGTDTVTVTANNQIADSSAVTINAGGVLGFSNVSDTIGMLAMTAGSVTTGSGTLTLGGNVTGSANAAAATIAGNLNLGGATRTFTIADGGAASDMTISAVVSNGGLTKQGLGTLTLSGANTYTDLTSVSAGVLNIQHATALGTTAGATSVASGAALQMQGGITVGTETLTLNGSGIGNDGALRNISGNNSYGGLITLGSDSRINSDAGTLTLSAGATILGETFNLTVGGAGNTTINSIIGTVGGTLTKDGAGILTLTGTNTYTDTTTVSAGILNIQNGSALGDDANGTVVASGAALQIQGSILVGTEALSLDGTGIGATGVLRNISGTNTYGGLVTLGGTTRINSDAGTLTLSNTGTITGATFGLTVGGAGNTTINSIIGTTSGTLTKDGAGTLTLTGANTYTGTTTLSAGVLNIQSDSALGGTANGTSVASGAALQIQGNITVGAEALTLNGTGITTTGALRNISGDNAYGGLVTLGSATRINSDAGTLTLFNTGTITGATFALTVGGAGNTTIDSIIGTTSGTLTKDGAGTLTLTGANTYTGTTTVSAGALNIQNASGLGTTAAGTSIISGAALQLQGGITVGAEALTLNGTGITTTGALRNISEDNTYGGLVTLGLATRINSDSGTLTLSNTGTITGATLALTVGGAGDTTINSIIGTTSGTLTKDGDGILTLAGANTYTGLTTIKQGTLSTGSIVVSGGASGLGNAATAVVLGDATNTGMLNYTGGVATYTRGFTVTAGSGGGGLINSSSNLLTISTGGTAIGSAATMTFQTLDTGGITVNSVISGAGGNVAVNSFGSGVVTFSGANTYAGATTVSGGILKAGVVSVANTSGAFGLNSAVILANTAGVSMDITGFNTQIGSLTGGGASGGSITLGAATLSVGGDNTSPAAYAGVISGTGALVKIGTGTLTLSGASTYTGLTTISRGTLSAGNIVVSAGASSLGNAASAVVLGDATNTGTLSYTGAAATYTRGFSVTAGTGGGGLTNTTANLLTMSSGGTAVGNGATMTFGAADSGGITVDNTSVISGAGGKVAVNSPGSGVVTFNAANTYTGTTTISQGTLATDSIVVSGGASGLGNAASAVILGDATHTGTLSYSGGAATYTRGFTATAGSGGGALSNTTANLLTVSTGGTAVGAAAAMTFGAIDIGGITVNSVISGAGRVVVNSPGSGVVTLGAANTYTGTTTISQGTLSTGSIVVSGGASGLGNATTAVVLGDATGDTGTLSYTGAAATYTRGFSVTADAGGVLTNTTANLLTMTTGATAVGSGSTMTFDAAGSGGITVNSVISGAGDVVINSSGSGVVTFLGDLNTYTGATLISSGTLSADTIVFASGDSDLGAASSPVILGDTTTTGTLRYTGAAATYLRGFSVTADGGGGGALTNTTANLLQMSTGGTFVENSLAIMTFATTNIGGITVNSSSVISGDGNVAINSPGSGVVTFLGANTYTGLTSVSAGALNIQNATALGTTAGATTVSAGGALQLQGGITVGAEGLTLNGTGVGATGALRNISGTNAYGGLITLGSATRINSDAGTLTLSNAGTITGATFGLTVGGAGNTTIDSIIGTTSGTVTKDGAGTLTLTGANTYTGTTTVSDGVLNIQNDSALGTTTNGTSVASGKALQIQGGITVGAEALTLNGTGISNDGALRNISGTNIYGGLVTLGSATRINSDAGTLTLSNTGTITGATFGLTVGGAGNTTINGIIGTSSGTLTKDGAGTLTLTGANTYTGTTTVSAGVLNIQNGSALGTTANGASVTSGAALQIQGGITVGTEALALNGTGISTTGALRNISGDNTYGGLITLGSATRINSDSGTLTLSNTGTITGATFGLAVGGAGNTTINGIIGTTSGTLTKDGAGTLTLTRTNTYTGATTVSGGILKAGASGAFGVNSAVTLANTAGVSMDITGFNTQIGSLTGGGASGGNVTLGAATLTVGGDNSSPAAYAGVISGTGGLTKIGTGTLILSGSNSFGGVLNIQAGTLSIGTINDAGANGVLGNSANNVLLGGAGTAGTLRYTGTDATPSSTKNFNVGAGGGTVQIDNAGTNLTLSGEIDGGTLTKTGAGTLTLAGANDNIGLGVIANVGTLVLGKTSSEGIHAIGGGGLTIGGATVKLSGTGGDQIYAGSIVTVNSGTLDFNGRNEGFDTLAGSGGTILNNGGGASTLTISSGGGTYSGVIANNTSGGGTMALVKSGAGTETLNGANTYTGATTINGGTLELSGASGAIASSSGITINRGATLTLDDQTANANRIGAVTITMNGGTIEYTNTSGAHTETVGQLSINSSASTVNSSATTTGSSLLTFASLARTVGATVNFTGALSAASNDNNVRFTSTPTLVGGIIGGYATVGGTNWATYTTGSTASVEALGSYETSTTIGNWGTTENISIGANPSANLDTRTINSLRFTGNSTVTINSGQTLTLTSGGILATGAAVDTITGGTVKGAAGTDLVVNQNSSGTFTINSVIADNGSATGLTKSGTGKLTVGGNNTFTGATTVNEGTLEAGAAGALGSTSGITVNSGGTLLLAGAGSIDRINNSAGLTLAGGTLSTQGLSSSSETLGTLTLSANSTLDFGTGTGDQLFFAGVGAHTGGATLSILNWSGTVGTLGIASSDRLIFTGTTTDFTNVYAQADVSFAGFGTGYSAIQFGGHFEIVAVPEPTTIFGALALLGLVGYRERRRLAVLIRPRTRA